MVQYVPCGQRGHVTQQLQSAGLQQTGGATHVSLHSVHGVSTRVEQRGVDYRTWYQVTNPTHLENEADASSGRTINLLKKGKKQ